MAQDLSRQSFAVTAKLALLCLKDSREDPALIQKALKCCDALAGKDSQLLTHPGFVLAALQSFSWLRIRRLLVWAYFSLPDSSFVFL